MNITISLQTKITIVFGFLVVFLIMALLPFQRMEEMREHEKVIRYYENLLQPFEEKKVTQNELISYLLKYNFEQINNPHEILRTIHHPIIRKKNFETFSLNNDYYLHILTPNYRVLFIDKLHTYERNNIDLYMFLFAISLFGVIYYLIIKNIKDNEHQLKSRQLFLRTIMHELKTPIAKGRIVSELLEDEKQKNRMIKVFEKLNFLIDDFAKVEQIVSHNYKLNLFSHKIDDIVQKSIDMLLLEKTDTIKLENISSTKLSIDFNLFPMALKNLIDNGLKYSNDKSITIKEEDNRLFFISHGEKLQKPLEEYFKPFHTEIKDKNHGMGLGLYIIHSILKMHNMKLDYVYKENRNIFSISF